MVLNDPVTTSWRDRRLNAHQRRRRYAAQVRSFIEASEFVDVDEETVKDILDGFDPNTDMGKDDDGADDVDEDEDEDEDEENGSGFDGRSDFPYFDYTDPSRWWSFEVVNNMKTYLRRHGMKSFMVRYAANLNPPVNMIHLFGIDLCDPLRQKKPKTIIYFLKVAMTRELHNRVKLKEYNTIEDATYLIGTHRRILILTGAGISVSCGIPDFRSQNGLYASLKNEGQYELDDPQQMFDINYFKENPAVFYSFARQIYPSNFTPSPCHRFIKLVEDNGTLLRNYTQNIDTLETLAGVKNVLNCHGSFATASCLACNTRVPGTDIEDEILAGDVPLCKICSAAPAKKVARKRGKRGKKRDSDDDDDEPPYPPWVMKPDITFFGEKLSVDFEKALKEDRSEVDLIIIIGTSMKVAPVSEFLVNMPHHVPQILINKTPIRHINPDIILLGDADAIVEHLCASLSPVLPDWVLPSASTQSLQAPPHSKKRRSTEPAHSEPRRVGNSHVWLFEGAEGGKWLAGIEAGEAAKDAEVQASTSTSGAGQSSTSATRRDPKRPRMS